MKNILVLSLSLSATVLLAGCSTPELNIPEQPILSREEVLTQYNVDKEWWHVRNDPQLDRLVERALTNNIDLAKAAINVNRALYQANALGADLVPTFSAPIQTGSFTVNPADVAGQPGNHSSFSLGTLSVSYELDLWGKLSKAASAQEWEYMATKEDLEASRMTLVNNVIKTYYNIMYLRQAIEVSEQGIRFYENMYRIVDEKHRVGKVDGMEPISAQQSLLSERNNMTNLYNQLKQSEQTMRNLLNLRPDDPLDLIPLDLMDVQGVAVNLDIPISTLGLRPDIQAAEYRLISAYDNMVATRANLYPSITIGASLRGGTGTENNASGAFSLPLLGGSININFPFLSWNKAQWGLRTTEAQQNAAELTFIQTVTSALNEIDTYYYLYNNSLRSLATIQDKHAADVKLVSYRAVRYEVGTDELSLYLQARSTENNSQLQVLQAKAQIIEYENAIYQAMGGRLVPNTPSYVLPAPTVQTSTSVAGAGVVASPL